MYEHETALFLWAFLILGTVAVIVTRRKAAKWKQQSINEGWGAQCPHYMDANANNRDVYRDVANSVYRRPDGAPRSFGKRVTPPDSKYAEGDEVGGYGTQK